MLRHSVPMTLPFPSVRQTLEVLHVKWWISTPRFATLQEHVLILNIYFLEWESKPQPSR